MRSRTANTELKDRLDELYHQFNDAQSVTDPIQIVRRFTRADDQEIVGFCAAALAFGRVQSVLNSIEGLLKVMGPSPAAYVRAFDPARDRSALDHLHAPMDAWCGPRRACVGPAPDDRFAWLDTELFH